MISLAHLNACAAPAFVERLQGIFEHSPWVPERVAAARPFQARLDLLDAMRGVVLRAGRDEQLRLIRAHPKLGARGRRRAELTEASAGEQRRAGLDACSDAEIALLEALNRDYEARFEIPFILAIRGHSPASIVAAMRRRLGNDPSREHAAALQEIGLIAGYRLGDVVSAPAPGEARAMTARLAAHAGADGVTVRARELVREWLLAGGFELAFDGENILVGRCAMDAGAVSVVLNARRDGTAGTLHTDGIPAALVAIAVCQDLKAQGRRPPWDWVVLARPGADQGPSIGEALRAAGVDPDRVLVPDAAGEGAEAQGVEAAAATLENFMITLGTRHV